MKSIILKIGLLLSMICSSLLVELTFEGNRFSKENALIAVRGAVIVFIVVSLIDHTAVGKKVE